MHLTSQQALRLTEESLRSFLSREIREGLYLDYKASLSGSSDKDQKREFLKDVTAFANAAGGNLFLGVREPREGLTVDAQLIGLDSGTSIAHDLERLASTSIDPRIPGLKIIPVALVNGKSCVIIHIPPSLSRPHMVNHAGHRSFYVRHSESSSPMTTHEVRESVLTSSSAEARARQYIERRLQEIRDALNANRAVIFIQAMPLIAPEIPWDILSKPFEDVLRGDMRRGRFDVDLASNIEPRPTIDGLRGRDRHEHPAWDTEVHRTGYVSALYRAIPVEKFHGSDRFVLHYGICTIFGAVCHMLNELLEVSGTDVPYLVTSAFLNAAGTRVRTHAAWGDYTEPYEKGEILWPEHLRETGADAMPIAQQLCLEMFNAFGLKGITK